jgi:uncharacterized protein (DUF1330 family)
VTAYWLSRARVHDAEKFQPYRERVAGIIAQYGGTYLARGKSQVLEGNPRFDRYMVIAFPSYADALKCFKSGEYQAAAQLRREGGEVEIVIVDGDMPP